jgi:UDP-glucose 4-epimerase
MINRRIIRVGNLKTIRDYVHIEDVANALFVLRHPIPGRKNIYNVGTGKGSSGRALISLIEEIVGRKLRCVSDSNLLRSSDRNYLVGSTSALASEFGWMAERRLAVGLRGVLANEMAVNDELSQNRANN